MRFSPSFLVSVARFAYVFVHCNLIFTMLSNYFGINLFCGGDANGTHTWCNMRITIYTYAAVVVLKLNGSCMPCTLCVLGVCALKCIGKNLWPCIFNGVKERNILVPMQSHLFCKRRAEKKIQPETVCAVYVWRPVPHGLAWENRLD